MIKKRPKMLVIAPHPDDEILGPGGTIARFSNAGGEVTILTVAAHMPPLYPAKVHKKTISEAKSAHKIIGAERSIFLNNPAVLLENIPVPKFNASILKVIERVEPDVLLVPYYDRHIDHQLVFKATMVACRPVGVGEKIKIIAAYETLSETHWNVPFVEPNFTPNWCVDITKFMYLKIKALECYKSQLQPYPKSRSIEAVRALAHFRGSQMGMAFAESFQVLRMAIGPERIF